MKRLNDAIAGLPDWPNIREVDGNGILVEGRHVSFGRYLAARWGLRLAALVYFYWLCKYEWRHQPYPQYAVIIVMGQLIAWAIILRLLPLARWISLLFRRHTAVLFLPDAIVIKGVHYNPAVGVQFRANRPLRRDRQLVGVQPHQADYLSRFRLVEMVYNVGPVKIASVEYEDKAELLAVVLQWAFDYSRKQQVTGASENRRPRDGEPQAAAGVASR